MRQAELERQRRFAPHLARLKVETALAVAAFNVRVLSPSPLQAARVVLTKQTLLHPMHYI